MRTHLLSLISLVLVGPLFRKENKTHLDSCNGRLIIDYDGRFTCTFGNEITVNNCHYTAANFGTTGTFFFDFFTTENLPSGICS